MAEENENEQIGLVNPDGSFAENYLDVQVEDSETKEKANLFPDEVRGHDTIRNFKNLGDVYKTVLSQQKLIGKNRIPLPGKDAKPEEWDETMKTLGWPEKPEGYDLKPSETDNKELVEWFTNTAHAGRFLPSQVKFMYDEWNKYIKGRNEQQVTDFNLALQKGMEHLKTKFGQTFDKRMGNTEALIGIGIDAMKELGFEDEALHDIEERLMNDIYKDPRIGAFLSCISEMISEDSLREGVKRDVVVLTPAEAKVQAQQMRDDTKGPYWDKDHALHKEYVDKMDQLTKISLGA